MTSDQARSEIFAMLKTDWDLYASQYSLSNPKVTPNIYWQGIEYPAPPQFNEPHARTSVHHLTGRQASLGPTGNRLFERTGVIVVQCYGPVSSGKSLTIADGLANIAKNAFEGRSSPGGIWFRNCRISEVGSENGWFVVNLMVDFSYDEVK